MKFDAQLQPPGVVKLDTPLDGPPEMAMPNALNAIPNDTDPNEAPESSDLKSDASGYYGYGYGYGNGYGAYRQPYHPYYRPSYWSYGNQYQHPYYQQYYPPNYGYYRPNNYYGQRAIFLNLS